MVVLSPSQTFVLSKNRNKGFFVYLILRPSQGLWDSGKGAIYFQEFGEKGHLFSWILGESITIWGFREQGAGG